MINIDVLKQFGADTDDGLSRCMGNEAFYFKLIGKVVEDKNFQALEDAVAAKDLDKAFEAAHSLKGVLGNRSMRSRSSCARGLTSTMCLTWRRSRPKRMN